MNLYRISWYTADGDNVIGRDYYILAKDIDAATKPAMNRFKHENAYPFKMNVTPLTNVIIRPDFAVFDGCPGVANIEYIDSHEPSSDYLAGILDEQDVNWVNALVSDNIAKERS